MLNRGLYTAQGGLSWVPKRSKQRHQQKSCYQPTRYMRERMSVFTPTIAQPATPRLSASQEVLRRAVVSQESSVDDLEAAKARVITLAREVGNKEKSSTEYKNLRTCIDDLKSLNPNSKPADLSMRGTKWATLYSDSKGPSSGRIGPFMAKVEQTFSSDSNTLINSAELGPLKLSLNVAYEKKTESRITVTFAESKVAVLGGLGGALEFKNDKQVGRQGYWEMVFADDDLRVFFTNAGSMFIVTRTQ
mmetsp:Transcript_5355/g.10216  ORF Transcript_5355/g.10216 Transcript_5355/m.10216 type:complete len:247 (+) Transcript_5355:162-902(+)